MASLTFLKILGATEKHRVDRQIGIGCHMPASVHLLRKFKPERCSISILLSCHPGNKEPTCDLLKSVSFCPQGGWRETHPGLIWCKWPTGVRAKPASGAKGSGWNVPWVMGADATQRLEVIETSDGVWRWRKVDGVGRGNDHSSRLLVCCSGYAGITALDTSFQSGCLEGLMCLLLVS